LSPHLNRTIVVGAGGGGIVSALLASLRQEHVTLIEAHSALGGCASWFRRGQFIFDAGATTVSGVNIDGPLGELFEKLGAAPELRPSDPGIVFHLSSGKVVSYHKDFELWMRELSEKFPTLSHRPFWDLVLKVNRKGWSLLRDVKTFPFSRPQDILGVFKHPTYASLVPYLFLSTEHALRKFQLYTEDYLELVNGILLISAQAEAHHIPFMVGCMALAYPAETYAPVGGMKGLMDFFEGELRRRNVELMLRKKVQSFSSHQVKLSDGSKLEAERLILNLAVWNLAELAHEDVASEFRVQEQRHPGSWGAFTLYFGMKSQIRELYQQVHLNHPLVKNYFVSFSIPGDQKRAPEGFQAVTISTHVFAESEIEKPLYTNIIMDDFMERFGAGEIKFLTSGSPKTFERYTGRKMGFVGGLPFLFGKNPLSLISPLTQTDSLFRVGDTVFPGQGLCGVAAGALSLDNRIRAKA
jgi:phytoene dehydrogenase-like protein